MLGVKLIEEVTIQDLKANRWSYYHNDELGFDCFEHVISDSNSDFNSESIELELAVFEFDNGKILYGSFDGSESFNLFIDQNWITFWYGACEPPTDYVNEVKTVFEKHSLKTPFKVTSQWSKKSKLLSGLQYLDSENKIRVIPL